MAIGHVSRFGCAHDNCQASEGAGKHARWVPWLFNEYASHFKPLVSEAVKITGCAGKVQHPLSSFALARQGSTTQTVQLTAE